MQAERKSPAPLRRPGILRPGYTDPQSGYRYYSSAQLTEANLIRMLRSLELSLEDIRQFLRERDPARKEELLGEHRERIEQKMEEYKSIVSSIERLTEGKGETMEREIETKELADQPVLGVRFKTSMASIGEDIGKGYEAVFTCIGKSGAQPVGPPFAIYYDMELKEEDIDMEACVPVSSLMEGEGNVTGRSLPGGKVASTLHAGPYEEFGEAYQALMLWINENGYRPAGPCREVYLVGPQMVDNPADYRTEVIFPIEKAEQI